MTSLGREFLSIWGMSWLICRAATRHDDPGWIESGCAFGHTSRRHSRWFVSRRRLGHRSRRRGSRALLLQVEACSRDVADMEAQFKMVMACYWLQWPLRRLIIIAELGLGGVEGQL